MPGPTVEQIIQTLADPSTITPERLELARIISARMAHDPGFLEAVERILADYADEIERLAPREGESASFGWETSPEEGESGRPRPAQTAAAAVAAAIAPVATPPASGH
jgi:hypothetical protein